MGNRPLNLALAPGEHFTASSSESKLEGVAVTAVYRAGLEKRSQLKGPTPPAPAPPH